MGFWEYAQLQANSNASGKTHLFMPQSYGNHPIPAVSYDTESSSFVTYSMYIAKSPDSIVQSGPLMGETFI